MSSFREVDTKKEAFKLVHDPVRLLCLLYSKYGDIEEDYCLLYANQLVYNRSSHLNIIFKEFQYSNNNDEFLNRPYKRSEIKSRIPKLSDYYKNYSQFFCKPIFSEPFIYELMHEYGEKKAEDFYKNNFESEESKNEEKKSKNDKNRNRNNNAIGKEMHSLSSLTSFDNITDNKIIFDKRNKKIIDNNLNSKSYSITLTMESINKKDSYNEFISKRSKGKSFEEMVKNIVDYKIKNKKKKKIDKKISQKKNNNNIGIILNMNKSKGKHKNKSYIFFSEKITTHFFSKVSSRFEEYNKNRLVRMQGNHKKNKTSNISNNNNYNYNYNHNYIKNSDFKNFTKLNKMFMKKKINITNNTYFNSYNNSHNNTLRANFTGNNLNNNSKLKNKVINYIINIKKKKNKTFDNNKINHKYINKYNINNVNNMNNMNNINNINISSNIYIKKNNKNNKLSNVMNFYPVKSSFCGSKFNLVKNPKLSPSIYQESKKKKKLNSFNNKRVLSLNNSGSIPKYNNIISPKGDIIIFNNNSNVISENRKRHKLIKKHNKNNFSYTNNNYNINFNNVIFCSQRSPSNIIDNINYNSTINNNNINIKNIYKGKNIKNYYKLSDNFYVTNLKNLYNISRNKIKIQQSSLTQNHSNNNQNKISKNMKSKNYNNTVSEKVIINTHSKELPKYLNKKKSSVKVGNKKIINFGLFNNKKMMPNNLYLRYNNYKKIKNNFDIENLNKKRNSLKNIHSSLIRGGSTKSNKCYGKSYKIN